jgi:hypothetical protein
MKIKSNKFIFWAPRILAMLFILFLTLFSLDIVSPELSFQQIVIGLFIHNIPPLILLIVLLISWKREIVGGIIFTLAGIFYITNILIHGSRSQFEPYMLSYSLIIAGPALLIGILFIVNWLKKDNHKTKGGEKNV